MNTKVTKAYLESGESLSSVPGIVNRLNACSWEKGPPDTSRVLEFESCSYLSNSDLDSQPVCVSNIRVFRELPGEGLLWVYRTGGYGSAWIEVRKTRFEAKELALRAERLGVESVAEVYGALARLEQYPILDEDDESMAEQEEQEEHWDSYGRHDFEKLLADRAESIGIDCDQLMPKDVDQIYWDLCEELSVYPERIDSSAWDFQDREECWGRKGAIRAHIEAGHLDAKLKTLFLDSL